MDTSGRHRATLLTLTVSLVLTTGCITTSPKLALRWPSDIKREKLERSLSLARLSERQGKFNDALAVYQKILESDPNNVTAHHRIGAIAVKEGRLADGRQEFERAAALGKPSAELLNDLGYLCYLEQDLPRAESQLRAALSTDPRYKNAHNNLGLVLAEMGRFDEALAEFKLVGSEAEAYSNLAYIQTKMGQLVDAERNYHKALSLDNSLRPAAEALLQLADLKSRATGTPPPGMMARQPTLPTVRQAAVGATPEAALIESVELGRPAVQPATVPTTTAPTPGRDRSVPGGRNAPSQVMPASGVESNDASVFADGRFDAYSWSGETPPADARTVAPANTSPSSAAPASAAPGQTPRNPAPAATTPRSSATRSLSSPTSPALQSAWPTTDLPAAASGNRPPGWNSPGTGSAPVGFPNAGYPNSGYPNAGTSSPGFPNSGYPSSGYPNPAYANPAYANPGVPTMSSPMMSSPTMGPSVGGSLPVPVGTLR